MLASCIALAFFGTALAGPVQRDLPTAIGSSVSLPSSTANATNTTDINKLLLLPAVHWEHDSNDLNNLKPNTSHMIYFTPEGGNADPATRHAFMQANITMQKPTVILDHCGTIKTVQCGKEGVSVVFNHKEAFDAAKSFWSSNFTMGTNTDDCGQLTHQSSFWDVKSLSFNENSLSVVATVDEEVDIGAHAEECEAAWGTWKPSANEPTPVSSGAAQITPAPTLHERDFLNLESLWNEATSEIVSEFNVGTSLIESVADVQTAVTGNIPLDAKPTAYDAAAPWPSAFKLADLSGKNGPLDGSFKSWCVDCYTKGNVQFAGSVTWSVTEMKVTKAQGDMSGDLEAQFIAGLDADGSITPPSISVTIFNPNVEQWIASSLLEVGPYAEVRAQLDTKIDMKGQAKLGTKMNMGMEVSLDLLDGAKSSHSFKDPTFEPVAEANMTIGLTASLGFPIEIGFGIDVKAISFSKKVALTETPKFIGHIEGSLGTNANDQEKSCKGLPWDVTFNTDLSFTAWDTNIDLFNKTYDVAHGCINLPDSAKSSSSMSTVVPSTVSRKAGTTTDSSKATSTASNTKDHASNSASGTTALAPTGTGLFDPLGPIQSALQSVLHSASGTTASIPAGTILFDPSGPIQSELQSVLHSASGHISAITTSASAVSQSASVSQPSPQSIIIPTPNVVTSELSHISIIHASESVLKVSLPFGKSASATAHSGSAAQSTSVAVPADYSTSSTIAAPAASSISSSVIAPVGYSTSSSVITAVGYSTSSSVIAPAGYSTSSTPAASITGSASSVSSAKSTEEANSAKIATTLLFKIKSSIEEKSSTSKALSTSTDSTPQHTPDVQPTASVY